MPHEDVGDRVDDDERQPQRKLSSSGQAARIQKHSVSLSPHDRALERLKRLAERPPLDTGQDQAFHVELSDTLREYVEERFHVRAQGMSTEEFLAYAGTGSLLDEDLLDALSGILMI